MIDISTLAHKGWQYFARVEKRFQKYVFINYEMYMQFFAKKNTKITCHSTPFLQVFYASHLRRGWLWRWSDKNVEKKTLKSLKLSSLPQTILHSVQQMSPEREIN